MPGTALPSIAQFPRKIGATTIGRAPSSPDSAAYSAEFAK